MARQDVKKKPANPTIPVNKRRPPHSARHREIADAPQLEVQIYADAWAATVVARVVLTIPVVATVVATRVTSIIAAVPPRVPPAPATTPAPVTVVASPMSPVFDLLDGALLYLFGFRHGKRCGVQRQGKSHTQNRGHKDRQELVHGSLL
jgi:hypothetical protein